jgi:ABC-type Fe3+/spermidine/putrescine transport system ATPase subunit
MNGSIRHNSVAPGAAPVAIERLVKALGGHRVLNGVDLHLEPGTFFTLVGPSGSGKTTLLNLIAGFERPDSGDIRINALSILSLPPHRRRVGVVFQNYALFPHLSVAENVAYPLRRGGTPADEISRAVKRSLDLMRLGAYAGRWVQQLSGGQQQRVAIARAIASQPSVLLMDEPMAALDKALREDLQVELKTLQRKLGATILYITHDQREAMALADRMAVLNAGYLEQVDAPERLYSRPQTSFVARFVGGATIFEGTPIVEESQWWLVSSGGHRLPGTWRTPPTGMPQAAELAVAPNDVRLHRGAEAPPDVWTIEATVVSTIFGGESSSIHVSLSNGLRLTARESGRARFQEGERIWVSWDSTAATLFPQSLQ